MCWEHSAIQVEVEKILKSDEQGEYTMCWEHSEIQVEVEKILKSDEQGE